MTTLHPRRRARRFPHRRRRRFRLTDLKKLHHLRRNPPRLQPRPFFGAFLLRRLTRFLCRLARLLRRRAGLSGCTLQTDSVGCLSGRLSFGFGDFPFPQLIRHREFQRHPFGSRPFHPCALIIGSACLPGSLGFFSGLAITFDLLRCVRPATRCGFPELLHLPEFFGSLLCPRDLAYLRQPFPRSVCPLQLVRPDQLQLLGYQRLAELNSAERIGARHGYMMESAREVTGHPLHFPGHPTRYFLTGYRFPTTADEKALVQRGSLDT